MNLRKPVFGNNVTARNNITLIENEKVVTSEIELAKIFNKYFVDIVPKLGIKPVVSSRNNDLKTGNLSAIIKKYKNHSSIIAIEKCMKGLGEKSFNFSKATNDIVLRNMQMLNTRKTSQLNDVPTKYIKKFSHVFTPVITDDYNNRVAIGIFPECFKTAEVIPTYKKDKPTQKTNYRPIGILSNISKIYERLMHDNMSDYFNDVLSKFQCGFRRGFGAQNCLLYMIETIRKTRDNHRAFAAVMTDLSKCFDCISHELLIAKINAYGFDKTSLKVIISYLKNCMQTAKVGSLFSELLNIIYGVPQGSILGPLLFIIYICDLFIVNKDVNFSSYADDTTSFITGMSFEQIIPELEIILSDISQWFMNNNPKANAGKFHLFLSPYEDETITVENYVIKSSGIEELLGVTTDSSLNFKEHILSYARRQIVNFMHYLVFLNI